MQRCSSAIAYVVPLADDVVYLVQLIRLTGRVAAAMVYRRFPADPH